MTANFSQTSKSNVDRFVLNAFEVAAGAWDEILRPKAPIQYAVRSSLFLDNNVAITYEINEQSKTWVIEVNQAYVEIFKNDPRNGRLAMIGTFVHEIAHSLGIGGNLWRFYFKENGEINLDEIQRSENFYANLLAALEGTVISGVDGHHSRRAFDLWFDDHDFREFVLPNTVAMMRILGHTYKERDDDPAELAQRLNQYVLDHANQADNDGRGAGGSRAEDGGSSPKSPSGGRSHTHTEVA